jgi:antitoxin MazE
MIAKMITQKITKWGNSLGIRLPQPIVQQSGWKEGEQLAITVKDEQIILSLARPKYSLAELPGSAKPENQHAEIDWRSGQGEKSW